MNKARPVLVRLVSRQRYSASTAWSPLARQKWPPPPPPPLTTEPETKCGSVPGFCWMCRTHGSVAGAPWPHWTDAGGSSYLTARFSKASAECRVGRGVVPAVYDGASRWTTTNRSPPSRSGLRPRVCFASASRTSRGCAGRDAGLGLLYDCGIDCWAGPHPAGSLAV